MIEFKNEKFELKVDVENGVVFEKIKGKRWKEEDMENLHNTYVKKIIPLFNGKFWAKICDLSEYVTSKISPAMKRHVEYTYVNGYRVVAVLTDDVFVATQMRNNKGGLTLEVFKLSELNKANEWTIKKIKELR